MRKHQVMIRVTEEEKRLLESKAEVEGLPVASWGRQQLLRIANGKEQRPTGSTENGSALPLLSLFCGPGGLDEGFRREGFRTKIAIDIDEECVRTFALNHPEAVARAEDIRKLKVTDLDYMAGRRFEPVGVLGGPPCQSFSVSNVHQKDDDPRHQLPAAYAKLLAALNKRNPISFFVFENVPGLLGKKHAAKYEDFKKRFRSAGFEIYEAQLDAKDYGVPQERPRIFVVGINKILHPGIEWTPPESLGREVTVRDAIHGLPEPVHNERGLDPETFAVHPNHWCLVPKSKKFVNANLEEGQAFGRSFRTLRWDKPSWTVAYGHREVHVHPSGKRRLSIFEAMRLQSFPDEYRLTGNMTAQIRLVSEAVPPKMAQCIAKSIVEVLELHK